MKQTDTGAGIAALPQDQVGKPFADGSEAGSKSCCFREGMQKLLVIYVQKGVLATKEYVHPNLKRAVGLHL